MPQQFNIWLILCSLFASTIAVLVTFGFVENIFKSALALKKLLLPMFSLFAGTGIWANHLVISFAFNHPSVNKGSIYWAVSAWCFAVLTAYLVLQNASNRNLNIQSILKNSVLGGLSTLALYYCSITYLNEDANVLLNNTSIFFTEIFTMGMIAVITLILFKSKSIGGKYQFLTKLGGALIISLSITAIHLSLNSALISTEIALKQDVIYVNEQLMGAIIALAFITLFLLLFIVSIFFERHGIKLFNYRYFENQTNTDSTNFNTHDSLTKLPNRYGFQQHLNSSAKRSTRAGNTFAVAYIDLDYFKPINDQYGHHVGDIVLSTIADRISVAVRACDFVARVGGDEFVAIIDEISCNDDIHPIVDRVLSSVRKPFIVEGHPIELSCSIGIAIYPKDGDLEKLLVCADSAMYRAKESGKNQIRFYDLEAEIATDQMLEMQRDLRSAMANGEFYLAYQPKLDCKSLVPTGAEALIRWRHPTKGIIQPADFLYAADRFGLTNAINDWVIEECCGTIFRAKENGFNLNISINLPHQQFRNINLVDNITKLLKFYDLDSSNLTLEIKETSALTNEAQFKSLMTKLNAAGIRVTLDDFGLHPISLQYLQSLNVKELKLDKIFVSVMNDNKSSKDLINGVIQLAHALNLTVVAEGVENEMQWHALNALGCDQMQGFLFSKAVEEDKLFDFFKQVEIKQLNLDLETSGKLLISDFQAISSKTYLTSAHQAG